MNVELAFDVRDMIGEGPVWDAASGRLCWVDIPAGVIHRCAPSDGSDCVLAVGQPVGALALGVHGGLVVALRDGFGLIPAGSDRLGTALEIERDIATNRMNDGRCDPAGRFWAGTMAVDHTPEAGSLYRLDEHGGSFRATRILGGLTISNGLDWSPDGQLLYYIDSATQRIDVFDFDVDGGEAHGRRTFVSIPEAEGLPDGMVVDAAGCVWVALFGAGVVRRYTPSGELDLEIGVPVSLVTSMAFGGADLGDLYITTARHRLTDEERRRETHAGGVFVCRPGPCGMAARRFQWI